MVVWEHPHIIKIPRNGTFKVVAFGDVHLGAKACNEKRFERQVIKDNADDPNAYFLGIGDHLDLIGPGDPRFRTNEGDELEDFVDSEVDRFANLFKKYGIPKERFIGMAVGNHEDTIRRKCGTDPTNRLCRALGTKNLGFTFFVKLKTRIGPSNLKIPTVIFGQHGFAGGRKEGSSVNAYTDHAFRHPGASVYLYGHNHKKWSLKVPTVRPDWKKMEQKDNLIIVGDTGTYMMTYSKGTIPSYAEKKGMYPVHLGHLELIYTHRCDGKVDDGKWKQREYLDIRVLD